MNFPFGAYLALIQYSAPLSWVAWAVSLACGIGLLFAVMAWNHSKPRGQAWSSRLLPAAIIIGGLVFSYLALPHSQYRYEGEDFSYSVLFSELQEARRPSADPIVGTNWVHKMSRLHLAAILGWHRSVLRIGSERGWDLRPDTAPPLPSPGSPNDTGALDPPYGWRVVGLATWALAVWFLYGLARRWGAWRSTAALGVVLCMSAPAVLFHANCLSDHLVAAVFIVIGLHLQLRRLACGRLLTGTALLEGTVVLGAAFYTHWTSLFLLVPLALMRLVTPEGDLRKQALHIVGLGAGALVAVFPELPRISEASQSNTTGMFANYPPEAGLALISHKHLFANLNTSSLAAFTAPAGEPAFVVLAAIGCWALFRTPPPGGRKALALVAITALGVLIICFTHIHPGSRWLLPLNLWMSLVIARGLQTLLTLPALWKLPGRLAAAALVVGAAHGTIGGMSSLKEGWFAEVPPHWEQLRSELPVLPKEEILQALSKDSTPSGVNIISSPTSQWTSGARRVGPRKSLALYTPPVVTWSRTFRDNPTLYLSEGRDFGWSAHFQRDYLAQLNANFTLQPAFVVDSYLAFLVSPKQGSATPAPDRPTGQQ